MYERFKFIRLSISKYFSILIVFYYHANIFLKVTAGAISHLVQQEVTLCLHHHLLISSLLLYLYYYTIYIFITIIFYIIILHNNK